LPLKIPSMIPTLLYLLSADTLKHYFKKLKRFTFMSLQHAQCSIISLQKHQQSEQHFMCCCKICQLASSTSIILSSNEIVWKSKLYYPWRSLAHRNMGRAICNNIHLIKQRRECDNTRHKVKLKSILKRSFWSKTKSSWR